MNIPGSKRVQLADLPSIDADVGTVLWVEDLGVKYEAVPRSAKSTGAVDGPADALTPISWQPSGVLVTTPGGTVAASGIHAPAASKLVNGMTAGATIAAASGVNVLWSLAVPVSTEVVVTAHLSLYSALTAGSVNKRCVGQLVAIAHRDGSGALAIDTQLAGAPWVLTDSSWAPAFSVSGNTLQFTVTSDATQEIVPKYCVEYESQATSDAPGTPVSGLRAAVIADGYSQLYFADAGTTPASPADGDFITALADQSGNSRTATFASNYQGKRRLDGIYPTIRTGEAVTQFHATIAGANPTPAAHKSIRWTMEKTDNATPSSEALVLTYDGANAEYIWIHIGAGTSAGTRIKANFSGAPAVVDFGECPTGKHDFEVAINFTTQLATLYVDGVAGTPQTMGTVVVDVAAPAMLGYISNLYPAKCDLYGFAVQISAVRDATAAANYITLSQLAWGAHD